MKIKEKVFVAGNVLLILFSGCIGNNQMNEEKDKAEIPMMQIVYEDGYALPKVSEDSRMKTYKGTSINYSSWVDPLRSYMNLSEPIQRDEWEEPEYARQEIYENGEILSVSDTQIFYFTPNYTNSADFLQLDPGDFYTGNIFSTDKEFVGFSREEAYRKLQEFGTAVGFSFPAKYTAYAMDTQNMEKVNQKFIESGDESAQGATIAQGEFYRFFFRTQEDGRDIFTQEDTYMGGSSCIGALVSKERIEMISVCNSYQYALAGSENIVDPSEAQEVIERKYEDIMSEEKVYISDCSLCYYQEKTLQERDQVNLIPIYAFSFKLSKDNPESKMFVDACAGKEIIIES